MKNAHEPLIDSARTCRTAKIVSLIAVIGISIARADQTGQVMGQEHETLTLKGHAAAVTSVVFSPDGQRLATVSGERWIRESTNGKTTSYFRQSGDDSQKLWDANSGREICTWQGIGRKSRLFSPDSKWLATANGSEILLWDTTEGHEAMVLKGHTQPVGSMAFSPDGRRLASAAADRRGPRELKLWNVTSGQTLFSRTGEPEGLAGPVACLAFSSDSKWLVTGSVSDQIELPERLQRSDDLTVVVWDASTGQTSLTLKGRLGHVIYDVAFSPDGKWLATAGSAKTVRVWDAATGQELLDLKGHTDGVRTVLFSPDGIRLASSCLCRDVPLMESSDRTVRLWDTAALQVIRTFETINECFDLSRDWKWLASGNKSDITLSDVTTGKTLRTLTGHTGEVLSLAFSLDGKRLATASADQTVRVWNVSSEQSDRNIKD
jgi:WD40 repeat protein